MGRTLIAAVVAGAVIAFVWLSAESPVIATATAAALVALAAAAAALPRLRYRAAGSIVAAVVAVRLAFGVWLSVHPIGDLDRIGAQYDKGFLDFYSTHLPFDPSLHPDMAAVMLSAVFLFTLAVGLLAAVRKPVFASLLLLVGAGWPATLLVSAQATAMGAAILGAVLVVLAVAGSRRISGLTVPVALALVLGGIAVGTAAASSHPVLDWQAWNLNGGGAPESVRFVWDSQYNSVSWPPGQTTMLDIRASSEPGYFRAAVLDDFVGGRWIVGPPRDADGLEPPAAFQPGNQTKQTVTIDGLVDTNLLGGSFPVRFAANAFLVEPVRGIAQLPTGYTRGFEYTVWSYTPNPSTAELAKSPASYPHKLRDDGMFDVGERSGYSPLARLARRVTAGAKTPYAKVVDLERWFLVNGGFRYSNTPRLVSPPLVGFVTTTRTGFCQHFAGAMALMLRYVGIPARVAVGFAGPTFNGDTWTFTDRDAHAWVEVWFKGYGWLPFDPTPAVPGSSRARLISKYTGPGKNGPGDSNPGIGVTNPTEPSSNPISPFPIDRVANIGLTRTAHHNGGGFSYPLVFLLILAGVVSAIALAKEGRRRALRLARDPRRIAAVCRDELASFLIDQGIDSPPSATIRELGLLAERRLGADVGEFVAATTAARFGRPEAAAAAAHVARRETGALRASCRRFLTKRDRLRGFLSMRSLARVRLSVDGSASLGSSAP